MKNEQQARMPVASQAHVVIVENRSEVSGLLTHVVRDAGCIPRVVQRLRDVATTFDKRSWDDLVVLDEYAMDEDLITACMELRNWYRGPLIVLSDYGSDPAMAGTLDAGADDYVKMPIRPLEFAARIRALLRRYSGLDLPARTLRVGDLELDFSTRSVSFKRAAANLTRVEFQILSVFMRHPERILTKDDIYKRVWNDDNIRHQLVRVHVGNVRKKLLSLGTAADYLRTVSRGGYILREPLTAAVVSFANETWRSQVPADSVEGVLTP